MTSPSVARRILEFWFGPVDPIRLDAFRRAFCLTLLLYDAHRFLHPYEWLTERGFHSARWLESNFGAAPDLLLPPAAVPLFGVVVFGSTLALIAGWRVRAMTWVALACAVYTQVVDRYNAFTMDKLYVATFALLALAPSPRRVAGAGPEPAREVISAWPLRVLQGTLLCLYFTAGYSKIFFGDWLESPDVLWSQVQSGYRTGLAAWLLRNLPREGWALMQHTSLAFEVSAPVLFCVRRLRPLAFLWGAGFHIMIGLSMYMLILFSLQMISYYVLFVDAGTLQRLAEGARRVRRRLPRRGPRPPAA